MEYFMFHVGLKEVIIIVLITSFDIALFTPVGRLRVLPTLLPLLIRPFNLFLKPSQLPGEYTACATNIRYSAKSITRNISALTGPHLHPWVER